MPGSFRLLAGSALVTLLVLSGASGGTPADAAVAPRGDIRDARGVVYRHYTGHGYRFQPLLSFARLNHLVSARRRAWTRRLAEALVARAVRRDNAVYWQYDFPFGGPVPWTSGFAQAVAAQALARTSAFIPDDGVYLEWAHAAFHGLRKGLVMPLGGGLWVREYGFTNMAILNAQLQSVLSIESYARHAEAALADRMAIRLYVAARNMLPLFDLGCWSRYSLRGAAATPAYHAYHVELVRLLARAHEEDTIWRATHERWRRCRR